MSAKTRRRLWLATIVGVVALLVVAVIRNRSSPDSSSSTAPPHNGVVEGFPEPTLYGEVLSVFDAVVRDGLWYALDVQGPQVHRLDPATGSVRSFGRRGEGPGEFRSPSSIVAHGDSVMVVDRLTLHAFSPAGRYLASRHVRIRGSCGIRDVLSTSGVLLFLVRCSSPEHTTFHVLQEARSGVLTELASHTQDLGNEIAGMVVVGPHPNGFLFGRPYDDCLDLYGPDGIRVDEVCHRWIERLPTPEMSDETKKNLEMLEEQARQLGYRIQVPDHLPPFGRVSATATGTLVYHAPSPDGVGLARLFTRSAIGRPVVVPVPAAPVTFVDGDHILLGWEELDGMRLLFLDIPRIH